MRPRIAVLTHSTNPRGAVVHAMQLAEALCGAGYEATLIAPDAGGRGFFRAPACPSLTIPAQSERDIAVLVARRIPEIAAFLTSRATPRFDVLHAQDSITANALALLVREDVIDGFVRTIHHLDTFADLRLMAWQATGVHSAAAVCCVSAWWQSRLWDEHGLRATLVGNGCDTGRFQPGQSAPASGGPTILALGGVEPRKNTLGILRGFKLLLESFPDARLVIAGGATLLDHSAYRAAFDAELSSWNSLQSVTLAGVIDDATMPALYRQANVLASPSLAEGFGLCALEALACGKPVVVSAIPPFTEHFESGDVLWADPHDPASIAAALIAALSPGTAEIARTRGPATARRFCWAAVADAHRAVYHRIMGREFAHA